jgi:hypothetical protein
LEVVTCHEPGERNSEVIPERQELSTLVSEIIHELIGISILSHENLSPLEDRSVDLLSAML